MKYSKQKPSSSMAPVVTNANTPASIVPESSRLKTTSDILSEFEVTVNCLTEQRRST